MGRRLFCPLPWKMRTARWSSLRLLINPMLTGEWVLHMLELRGITWNHTRGFLPVVASAQRFAELHPEVTIHWQKRSLQAFADYPLEKLVSDYDLVVIDHPAVGSVAENRLLVPLDECMPEGFLADLAENSVGRSHESYYYAGHQWALAIDAAAPICGYRPDLFAQHGIALPRDWEELLELARAGFVAVAGVAIDSLCHFYMLCIGLGEEPFSSPDCLVPRIPAFALWRCSGNCCNSQYRDVRREIRLQCGNCSLPLIPLLFARLRMDTQTMAAELTAI